MKTLQPTYPNTSPNPISNLEIQNFLNQNKARMDQKEFKIPIALSHSKKNFKTS